MNRFCVSHLSDQALDRALQAIASRDRETTALYIAHLAEFDARRRYAPAGHPSLFSYCVHVLGLSEESAAKRIRAARVAQRCPAVLEMLADGRLHVSAVVMLASSLTRQNATELLDAATGRTEAELRVLLAGRFPRPDLPERIGPVSAGQPEFLLQPSLKTVALGELAAVSEPSLKTVAVAESLPGDEPSLKTVAAVGQSRGREDRGPRRTRVTPLSADRVGFQFTVSRGAYEKFEYVKALLGHAVPSGEAAEVFEFALKAAIEKLERRKFAATSRPRGSQRRLSTRVRHVPAAVKRAVWVRDQGRCTFVSDSGHRCSSRTRLEFDHVEPVARGGESIVANLRLRCRAHNQLAAERAFGAGFMAKRREATRRGARERRARRETGHAPGAAGADTGRNAPAAGEARARAAAIAEVIPWLRSLGLRMDEARHAAARCESLHTAPLEERVRYALSCSVRPRVGRTPAVPNRAP